MPGDPDHDETNPTDPKHQHPAAGEDDEGNEGAQQDGDKPTSTQA